MSWAGVHQINIEQLRDRNRPGQKIEKSNKTHPRLLPTKGTLVCFSHLRWHFVYQRPQHLMERFARENRVFFVEEPIYASAVSPLGS
jgi:UDP-galactopyranose mutase